MNTLILITYILQLGLGTGIAQAAGGGAVGSILGGLAGTAASFGLGLLSNSINNQNQQNQNQALLNQQLQYNKDLTQFNEQTQLDLWNKTNYEAQVQQMIKAGLNPALMYKSGAGGQGTTALVASNSSQPAVASNASMSIEHQQELNQEQQKMEADIANTIADTLNKQADTNNKQVQKNVIEASAKIADAQSKVQTATVEEMISMVTENLNKLGAEMHTAATNQWIAENNAKTVVETTRLMYMQTALENGLIQSKTNLTNEQIKQVAASIAQGWKQLQLEGINVQTNKQNATTNWINAITNRLNATTNQTNAETQKGQLMLNQTINDMSESTKTTLNTILRGLSLAALAF